MNLKAISYYLSLLCFPLSILAFINILYSSYFDYFLNIDSYTITMLISLFLGIGFYFFGKTASKKIDFIEQLLLIVLSYLTISFLISIPYYLSNYQIPFINALFEGFSGVTGTGFTIFDNIKYLDPTLILWRSSSQWIGGLYFLIFLILLFSNKQFTFKLNYLAHNSDGNINSVNNIKNIILKIFLIYLASSILIFILLTLTGVRLYNSLNLGMTLVSAGGFLPTNLLSQIINNNVQQAVLAFSFLLSMLNFFMIFNLFDKKKITKEHNEDFALVITSSIFIIILLIFIKDIGIFNIILGSLSSLSSSGLAIIKIPDNLSLYFLMLALIGGSIISNSSGIKFIRIYILLKSTMAEILRLVRPNNILNLNILNTEKKINNDNIKDSFLVFISFFISLFILSGVLILDDMNFENSFKLSILTLTNTVNSELYGISSLNFANLLTSSKISLIIFMIIGKIELISVFLIIKKLFFKN